MRQDYAVDWPMYLSESLEEAMGQAAVSSPEALHSVRQLQTCLGGPEWADKGPMVDELIDCVCDLEESLTEYDHLVREELFPRVRKMCQSQAEEKEVRHAF